LVVLEFEFGGFKLAGQALYHLSHSINQPFTVLGIFEIGSSELFAPADFEP
jgi:hypothetical protein